MSTWSVRAFLLFALALVIAPKADAAIVIRSDFEASTEGWTHVGATTFEQNPSGGNPGGFLYVDNSEGPVTYIVAPAKFLGDLRGHDGGSISFDGNMLGIGGTPWESTQDYGHLTLSSSGLSATLDLLPPSGQPIEKTWTTFSAAFTAATWGKSPSEWNTLLSNVTDMRLSVEAMFGDEVQGIDNFTLTPVPEPHAWMALLVGLAVIGHRRRLREARDR